MDYSVIILKDVKEGGYIGMCKELPEAKSQGETIDELLENMKDAIKLTLEVRKEYAIIIKKNKNGWYTGQCKQEPEAISQGATIEELKVNMADAIRMVLDYKR